MIHKSVKPKSTGFAALPVEDKALRFVAVFLFLALVSRIVLPVQSVVCFVVTPFWYVLLGLSIFMPCVLCVLAIKSVQRVLDRDDAFVGVVLFFLFGGFWLLMTVYMLLVGC